MWKVFKKFPKLWYHYKVCTPLSVSSETSQDDTKQKATCESKPELTKKRHCFFSCRHRSPLKREELKVEAVDNSQSLVKFSQGKKYEAGRQFNYGTYFNNEFIRLPTFEALGLGLVVFFGLKHAGWNSRRVRNDEEKLRNCPGLSNFLFSIVFAVKGNYPYQLRNHNLPFVVNERLSPGPQFPKKKDDEEVVAKSSKIETEKATKSEVPSESEIRGSLMSLARRYTAMVLNVEAESCLKSQDFPKAIQYFREASNMGLDVALYNLGVCYETGTGVEQDLEQAFHFYMEAGKKGNVAALYNVAVCYMDGIGVSVDEEESVRYMLEASNSGLKEAQTYMGIHYGRRDEYDKAAAMFEKAVEQKYSDAEYFLGLCYEHGLGVECDAKKAADLFSRSASAGNAEACYRLANYYDQGLGGLSEDAHMASELLHLAANEGHELAVERLIREGDKSTRPMDESTTKKQVVRISISSPDLNSLEAGVRQIQENQGVLCKASSVTSVFSFFQSLLGRLPAAPQLPPTSKFYLEDENESDQLLNLQVSNVNYVSHRGWATHANNLINV